MKYSNKILKLEKKPFYLKQHKKMGHGCGSIAVIHSLTNSLDCFQLKRNSHLHKFFNQNAGKSPGCIGLALTECQNIRNIAQECSYSDLCQTQPPLDSQYNKLGQHFISFVCLENILVELNGSNHYICYRKTSRKTFLFDVCQVIQKHFIAVEKHNVSFSVLALVRKT